MPTTLPEEATRTLLARLWQRNLPLLRERLDLLDRAAVAAAGPSSLAEDLRHEASNAAHKLAGSLGMFGYPGGTDAARAIELLLDEPQPDGAQLTTLTQSLRAELFPAP